MRIGLFLPNNLDEQYQITIFNNIQQKANELGISLLCIQQESLVKNKKNPEFFFQSRDFINVDGILLLTSVITDHKDLPVKSDLLELFPNTPILSVGNQIIGIPSIVIKNKASMESLINHLIDEHSYRKMLYVGGPKEHFSNITREHVFKTIIEKRSQEFPELQGTVMNGLFNEFSGRNIIEKCIKESPDDPPDVIVSANDNMAIGVLKTLHTNSEIKWQKCPVTGFDDIPQAALEMPSLTTVHQPIDVLGAMSVEMMYHLMRGESLPLLTRIDSHLCIRNSCGCVTQEEEPRDDYNELKNKMVRFQYQGVKVEQEMQASSAFGQHLNGTNQISAMIPLIRDFLGIFGMNFFAILIFADYKKKLPESAFLIYEKNKEEDKDYSQEFKKVSLKTYFNEEWQCDNKSSTRVVHYLTSGNERIGMIVYEAEDVAHPYMCSCAVFISNAIRRYRMLDEEKRRAENLSEEVERRTKDLMAAHKKLEEESLQRIRVEAEVLKISEMERMRFSMDLHDDICQRLAGISMICRGMSAMNPDLEELSSLIDETLHRTRQYAHDSFPMELDTLGLKEAIGALCHSVEKTSSLKCVYQWDAKDSDQLDRAQKINIFRIIQEALHNVVKHSKAKNCVVSILQKRNELTISVMDDGVGYQKTKKRSGQKREGLGLKSMQYRADQIGALYSFHSSAKSGTLVKLCFTLKADT